jgi:hypothetical protein
MEKIRIRDKHPGSATLLLTHPLVRGADLCPQCVAFYGNRSACYLMLGQPRQALEDAKTATTLDPTFTKG